MDVDPPANTSTSSQRASTSTTMKRKVSGQATTKPPSRPVAAKAKSAPVVVDLEADSEDDSEVEVAAQSVASVSKPALASAAAAAKGKQKAAAAPSRPPASASQPIPRTAKPPSGASGHASSQQPPQPRSVSIATSIGTNARMAHSRPIKRSEDEWQSMVDHLKDQATQWETKFQALMDVRQTSVEAELERTRAVAEQHIAELEQENQMLVELNEKVNALVNRGGQAVLNYLTEEGADLRIRKLTEDNRHLKAALVERDARMAKMDQELNDLRTDLQAEITRSNQLDTQNKSLKATVQANKSAPQAAVQHSPPRNQDRDKRTDAAVTLYEDLSKVMVIDVVPVADGSWRYHCAVKHAKDEGVSVQFTLQNVGAPGADASSDGSAVTDWYLYTPIDRSTVTADLGYFGTQFRFPREQALDLLLQLLDNLEHDVSSGFNDGDEEEEGEENDDSVQEISR